MKVRIGSVPSLTIPTCSTTIDRTLTKNIDRTLTKNIDRTLTKNINRTLTKNNVTICTKLPIIARFPVTGFVISRFSIITFLLLFPSMAIKSRNSSIVVQASSDDHHFKVVACLSESSSSSSSYTAQQIENALSSWQSKNEKIEVSSGEVVEGRNVGISVSTVSIGNDTSSVLPLLCDAIEIHNPSLILSFLDPSSLFLVQTAATTSALPLLTWSRGYRQPSLFHHDQGRQEQYSRRRRSDFNLLESSLDMDIGDLAEASFHLLRAQEWFDAILILDDSSSSDRLRFKLSNLCKSSSPSNPTPGSSSSSSASASVWNRLMTVQVSKSLLQNELYLEMSKVQSSYRRIILVHCDTDTRERVIEAAHSLNLFSSPSSSSSSPSSSSANPKVRRNNIVANSEKIWIFLDGHHAKNVGEKSSLFSPYFYDGLNLPPGILALSPRTPSLSMNGDDTSLDAIMSLIGRTAANLHPSKTLKVSSLGFKFTSTCWHSDVHNVSSSRIDYSLLVHKELNQMIDTMRRRDGDRHKCSSHSTNEQMVEVGSNQRSDSSGIRKKEGRKGIESELKKNESPSWPRPIFDLFNLVPSVKNGRKLEWKMVGNITQQDGAIINTIQLSASTIHSPSSAGSKHRFRVVTGIAPPFVQESTRLENGTCLTGVPCLRVNTSQAEEMVAIFTDFHHSRNGRILEGQSYQVICCSGISIDLLNAVARDLNFEYDLYLVADGLFGVPRNGRWDGITADLMSGAADMTFTAFSVTSSRVKVIDFSVPFFYSGVSCLSFSRYSEDVPLAAFLVPFSAQLWIAIFASLFITAIAAAMYEWFSPFGLNPWGRQRTKNFSLASAMWVMTSLLFSHLVTFKAPKSWPNKVLINVWAGFSVIFLATYTANIAAHFAGLFSEVEVKDFHDGILMSLKTGVARSSASEGYIMKENMELWTHIHKNRVKNLEEGLEKLRARRLEVVIGDTAILDYFRANDPGCNLRLLGDSIFDDAYAVGFKRGFPLKDAISELILEYNAYGFLDQLQRKWYGRVPCLEDSFNNLNKPNALGVRSVAGVFIMLGCGFLTGIILLILEHLVFRYFLPNLRLSSKRSAWKSPNLMFFSQKLYRFVNTVELVSPHHSAKEIIASLKEGQITSLFQKSLKRKAKEEARRRKSKSQFFEMIQEVRKVVREQKDERRVIGEESIVVTISNPASKRPVSACNSLESVSSSSTRKRRSEKESSVRNERVEGEEEEVESRIPSAIRWKERVEGEEEVESRIPSAIRWKDPPSVTSIPGQGEEEIVPRFEPDLNRSPPATSSLKATCRSSTTLLSTHPATATTLRTGNTTPAVLAQSISSPSSSFPPPSPSSSSPSLSHSIELIPVMKRHPDHEEREDEEGGMREEREGEKRMREEREEGRERMRVVRSISVDSFRSIHMRYEYGSGVKEEEENDANAISRRKKKKKSWSFDDLTCIRKRWNNFDANEDECRNSRGFDPRFHFEQRLAHIFLPGTGSRTGDGNSRTVSPSVIIMSRRSPIGEFESISCSTSSIDPVKLKRMKKEAIITLWKSSERQLLNSLQDLLSEKRTLEQKLRTLQQMLLKPP